MAQIINGLQLLPSDHILNTRIDSLPTHPQSNTWIAGIGGASAQMAPGAWWSGVAGFPINLVDNTQPFVTINQSHPGDPGPYPIPPGAQLEPGTDKHCLVLNYQSGLLYEMYLAVLQGDGSSWNCYGGQIVNMASNQLRPLGLNGVDAAGLPMAPLLIHYDEVASGAITHAIRLVVSGTQNTFLWPARYQAGIANPNLPPMGLRLRLKASFDLTPYTGLGLIILQAMKLYGLIIADNGGGSNVFSPSGSPDVRFKVADISQLKRLTAANFEAVDVSSLMVSGNSGQSLPPPTNFASFLAHL